MAGWGDWPWAWGPSGKGGKEHDVWGKGMSESGKGTWEGKGLYGGGWEGGKGPWESGANPWEGIWQGGKSGPWAQDKGFWEGKGVWGKSPWGGKDFWESKGLWPATAESKGSWEGKGSWPATAEGKGFWDWQATGEGKGKGPWQATAEGKGYSEGTGPWKGGYEGKGPWPAASEGKGSWEEEAVWQRQGMAEGQGVWEGQGAWQAPACNPWAGMAAEPSCGDMCKASKGKSGKEHTWDGEQWMCQKGSTSMYTSSKGVSGGAAHGWTEEAMSSKSHCKGVYASVSDPASRDARLYTQAQSEHMAALRYSVSGDGEYVQSQVASASCCCCMKGGSGAGSKDAGGKTGPPGLGTPPGKGVLQDRPPGIAVDDSWQRTKLERVKLCHFLLRSKCDRGVLCGFAHTLDTLSKPQWGTVETDWPGWPDGKQPLTSTFRVYMKKCIDDGKPVPEEISRLVEHEAVISNIDRDIWLRQVVRRPARPGAQAAAPAAAATPPATATSAAAEAAAFKPPPAAAAASKVPPKPSSVAVSDGPKPSDTPLLPAATALPPTAAAGGCCKSTKSNKLVRFASTVSAAAAAEPTTPTASASSATATEVSSASGAEAAPLAPTAPVSSTTSSPAAQVSSTTAPGCGRPRGTDLDEEVVFCKPPPPPVPDVQALGWLRLPHTIAWHAANPPPAPADRPPTPPPPENFQ